MYMRLPERREGSLPLVCQLVDSQLDLSDLAMLRRHRIEGSDEGAEGRRTPPIAFDQSLPYGEDDACLGRKRLMYIYMHMYMYMHILLASVASA